MSSTGRLSSKCQITLPAWARRAVGLAPGARVRIRVEADHIVLEPVREASDALEGALEGVYPPVEAYLDDLRRDRLP